MDGSPGRPGSGYTLPPAPLPASRRRRPILPARLVLHPQWLLWLPMASPPSWWPRSWARAVWTCSRRSALWTAGAARRAVWDAGGGWRLPAGHAALLLHMHACVRCAGWFPRCMCMSLDQRVHVLSASQPSIPPPILRRARAAPVHVTHVLHLCSPTRPVSPLLLASLIATAAATGRAAPRCGTASALLSDHPFASSQLYRDEHGRAAAQP